MNARRVSDSLVCDLPREPFLQMLGDEGIVVQVRIGAADSLDLLLLARAESLLWV